MQPEEQALFQAYFCALPPETVEEALSQPDPYLAAVSMAVGIDYEPGQEMPAVDAVPEVCVSWQVGRAIETLYEKYHPARLFAKWDVGRAVWRYVYHECWLYQSFPDGKIGRCSLQEARRRGAALRRARKNANGDRKSA